MLSFFFLYTWLSYGRKLSGHWKGDELNVFEVRQCFVRCLIFCAIRIHFKFKKSKNQRTGLVPYRTVPHLKIRVTHGVANGWEKRSIDIKVEIVFCNWKVMSSLHCVWRYWREVCCCRFNTVFMRTSTTFSTLKPDQSQRTGGSGFTGLVQCLIWNVTFFLNVIFE